MSRLHSIRLYAGGDRPFFEDVQAVNPTVYVIHNLLTPKECESLVRQAGPLVRPLQAGQNDPLQYTTQSDKFVQTQRVHLWEGLWQSPDRKAIQERIEQVTGFPAAHLSDWTVDRLTQGSYWQPHYDTLADNYVPMATITVFLSVPTTNDGDENNEGGGGEIVYPNTETKPPVLIRPVQGLAVVHHNTDEQHQFDLHSLHAILPVTGSGEFYVATKYILPLPVSNARRGVLPAVAFLNGGRLPDLVVSLHDVLVAQFGVETGGLYFDKVCVFVPVLILLALANVVGLYVHRQIKANRSTAPTTNTAGRGKKTTAAAATIVNPNSTSKAKKSKKKD